MYTLLNLTLKIEVNHQVIPVSKMFLNPNLQDGLDSAASVNAGYAHDRTFYTAAIVWSRNRSDACVDFVKGVWASEYRWNILCYFVRFNVFHGVTLAYSCYSECLVCFRMRPLLQFGVR